MIDEKGGEILEQNLCLESVHLDDDVKELSEQIIAWRRHFHTHPEPSLKEYKTSAFIKNLLKEWNVPFVEVEETGILAELKGTQGEGKTIFLRADMDALEMPDRTGASYCSQEEGLNHSCGHDGHTAALLGAVKILKDREFKGTVKFVFQAAEEIGRGAKQFINGGYLEGGDLIFGIHLHSPSEVGKVLAVEGPRSASCDIFDIEVFGESSHCAKPHQGKDALLASAHIAVSLQSIVSRRINPLDPILIAIGELHAGTKYNILAGKGILKGTLRCFDSKTREFALQEIEYVAQETAKIYGATAVFHNFAASPALVNDKAGMDLARKVLAPIIGTENIVNQAVSSLGGEDFADYLEYLPGAFLHVGTKNPTDERTWYPHHHEKFDIDERALPIATQVHVSYALGFLQE